MGRYIVDWNTPARVGVWCRNRGEIICYGMTPAHARRIARLLNADEARKAKARRRK